jgi:flagellar hook-length control protein FliK
MPQTSAVSLLSPPATPQTDSWQNAPSSDLDTSDSSFQQTLQTAQAKSNKTDDSSDQSTKNSSSIDKTKNAQKKTGEKPVDGQTDTAKASKSAAKTTVNDKANDGGKKKRPPPKKSDGDLPVTASGRQPAVVASQNSQKTQTDSADQPAEAEQAVVVPTGDVKEAKDISDPSANADVTKAVDPSAHPKAVPFDDSSLDYENSPQASAQPTASAKPPADSQADTTAADQDLVDSVEDLSTPTHQTAQPAHETDAASSALTAALSQQPAHAASAVTAKPAVELPVAPEAKFAEVNHPSIVSGVQAKLLPNGGSMTIRLDPPELGALQVSVHMRDGVMTAAFETSSDDATRMLSHSLGQLKTALEASGVSVEKLHVQQSPKQESKGGDSERQQGGSHQQQQQSQRDQQRREMLQRLWRRLSGGGDPLDLVA